MDSPKLEKTYVYPNRYMYWTVRHKLRETSINDQRHLVRRLVINLPIRPPEDHLTVEDLEEMLSDTDNGEMKKLFSDCIDSFKNCPSCNNSEFYVTYADSKSTEPMIKVCKSRGCSFAFGIDDSFSMDELVDKLNELNISPTYSTETYHEELQEDVYSTLNLYCNCGNENLDEFLVVRDEDDVYTVMCDRCGDTQRYQGDKAKKKGETAITKVNINRLKPGDHIFWFRSKLIEHHAIIAEVMDDNKVLVYEFVKGKRKRIVLDEEELFNTDEDPLFLVEYENSAVAPIVLQRAEAKMQENESYNLVTRNCEQFAKYCKTGEWNSFQWKRIREYCGVIFSKMAVKAVKEGAHIHAFKLVGRIAVKSGVQATKQASKFSRFIKGVVNVKCVGLLSNGIAFAIMLFIEVAFCLADIIRKRKEGCRGKEFRDYIKDRVIETAARIGVAGVLTLISLGVTAIFINLAISSAVAFFAQAAVMVVVTGLAMVLTTCLVRFIRRKLQQKRAKAVTVV